MINFFRNRVITGKIEAANAAISRIQAKARGLSDIPYFFEITSVLLPVDLTPNSFDRETGHV